jgi:hypothetical protein
MRRKQTAQHLDTRQQLVLENAYYQCNPPDRVQREQIQLTPMEAFVQHLLHDVLTKKTVDKVLKLLRKLHWEDAEVRNDQRSNVEPLLGTEMFTHRCMATSIGLSARYGN